MGKAKALKQQRRDARAAAETLTFWHGGVAGIAVGDHLLPPTETKDPASVSVMDANLSRPDRVYFTTDRELARNYAALLTPAYGRSALYRVRPIGEFESDPDFPTVGYKAKRALVLEVAEEDIELSSQEQVQRQQPYATWADGRLIWNAKGRLQLCREYEGIGLTQRDLDAMIAPWTPVEEAELTIRRWYMERLRTGGAALP